MERGQITIFLIFAVLVISALSIIYYSTRTTNLYAAQNDESAKLQAVLDTCMQTGLEATLLDIGMRGDLLSQDTVIGLEGGATTAIRDGAIQLLSLGEYAKQISDEVHATLGDCVAMNLDGAQGSPGAKSNIGVIIGDKVSIMMSSPYKISYHGQNYQLIGAGASIELNLEEDHAILMGFLTEASNDLSLIPLTPILSSHLIARLVDNEDGTYSLSLEDPHSDIAGRTWKWNVGLAYPEVTQ